MKQKHNTFRLSAAITAEAFFDGKVIKLVGEIKQTYSGPEPESVAYLRRAEFEALVAWVGYLVSEGSERSPKLVLDNNQFEFGYNGGKPYADTALEILKKIAHGVESQYKRTGLRLLTNEKEGLALTNAGELSDAFYLIRFIRAPREDFSYLSYSDLSHLAAYKSLSEASVTLADRLSAIIGMSTAPDTGYEVGLRNGIGDLKLLENASRDTLKALVEDLIR